MSYRTIVADPPWPYKGKGPPNKTAARGTPFGDVSSKLRYGAMSIGEILGLPVEELVADNAHLYLPEESYEMIERQSHGPYLELFARRPRKGWHVWGNQVESDVEL